MRYLVISDIHANFSALETVLDRSSGSWDRILCLGDIVGYGPHPNECVGRLAELPVTAVPGNHDWAALGRLPLDFFNDYARQALAWTRPRLKPESMRFLSALEPVVKLEEITLFHGALTGPITDYILNRSDADENFELLETAIGLFGHSHHRFIFSRAGAGETMSRPLRKRNRIDLSRARHLLNPGSVGQPREGDPRASYGILDTRKGIWELHRAQYDIARVQKQMRRFGLPEYLVGRLAEGR